MKFITFSLFFFITSTIATIAQSSVNEDENYKHSTKVHQHHATILSESDSISIRSQKTQKTHSRKYVVAPTDSIPDTNVQGRKTKANYKNQFN